MRYSKTRINKYRNNKVTYKGIEFDSKKEFQRYLVLADMQKNNEIEYLELQPKFLLLKKYKDNQGVTEREVNYIADFMYIKNGRVYVEDVKSKITKKDSTYILKRKLFKQNYPDYYFIENVM